MRPMTPKQQRFVDEYLIDLNATQAAIRAGYSAKTAESAGSRLLRNVNVSAAVVAGRENLSKRAGLTQDDVVKGLLREANLTGPGSSASARVSAWMGLAKIKGMLTDKVEHSGQVAQVHVYLPRKDANPNPA